MDIEELSARVEIEQALVRYCRGVDRGDVEMMASAYHPGAMDHHGPYDMEGREFSELITRLMDERPGSQSAQHHLTNVLIEVDGETARSESYFVGVLPMRNEAGEHELAVGAGRYVDRHEKRGGRWAIAERWVVYDWSRDTIPGAEWARGEQFPRGARGAADVSAALFGPSPAGVGTDG